MHSFHTETACERTRPSAELGLQLPQFTCVPAQHTGRHAVLRGWGQPPLRSRIDVFTFCSIAAHPNSNFLRAYADRGGVWDLPRFITPEPGASIPSTHYATPQCRTPSNVDPTVFSSKTETIKISTPVITE